MKKLIVVVPASRMNVGGNVSETLEHLTKFDALRTGFFDLADKMENTDPADARYMDQLGMLYAAYLKLEKAMYQIVKDLDTETDKNMYRKLTGEYPAMSNACMSARSLLNSYVGDHYLADEGFPEFACSMNDMAEQLREAEDMSAELDEEEAAMSEAIDESGKFSPDDKELSFVITPQTSKEEIRQYAKMLAEALFAAQTKTGGKPSPCDGCDEKDNCPVCE